MGLRAWPLESVTQSLNRKVFKVKLFICTRKFWFETDRTEQIHAGMEFR
jgi:hypothetical protein